MPEYQYIPDHPEQAIALMPSQFFAQPQIRAIMMGLGAGAQQLEDQLLDLSLSSLLDSATGATLDQWGELVGQARGPLNDLDYRGMIAAKAVANASDGTNDQIVEAGLAMGADGCLTFTLPAQACVLIELLTLGSTWSDARLRAARRVLEATRAAGIGPSSGLGMILTTVDSFRLDSSTYGLDAGRLCTTF